MRNENQALRDARTMLRRGKILSEEASVLGIQEDDPALVAQAARMADIRTRQAVASEKAAALAATEPKDFERALSALWNTRLAVSGTRKRAQALARRAEAMQEGREALARYIASEKEAMLAGNTIAGGEA